MVNKKIGLKIVLSLSFMVGLSLSFTSAAMFNVDLQGAGITAINEESITKNMMPIHFVDNGNDFGGFIYIQSGDNTVPQSLCVGNICGEYVHFEGGSGYICQQQVRGFYYNSERGERLWPLDDQTWKGMQPGLETEGGIYTRCVSRQLANALRDCANGTGDDEAQCEADARAEYGELYGYYGKVSHVYGRTETNSGDQFGLIAGATYNTNSSSWVSINSSFAENFVRYNNKYSVGLLYDYNGGVGFVGCEFKGNETNGLRLFIDKLNNGYSFDVLFQEHAEHERVTYSGSDINLNCTDVGVVENSLINMVIEGLVGMGKGSDMSLIGNQSDEKMQYFTSVNVNNTLLINYARKRAETLCRGKWESYDKFNDDEPLECVEGGSIKVQPGKTYVVKNGDVVVPAMRDFDDDMYYDIFIDNGKLLLYNGDFMGENLKKVFNTGGFIVYKDQDSEGALSTYRNEIGQAIGSGESYTGDKAAAGAFVKGNFIVNGNLGSSNGEPINSRYFIYGKFTTKDSFSDMENLFSWRCVNGISTDDIEYYCPQSVRGGWKNPYENAFLVVIDQNYKSKLFSS